MKLHTKPGEFVRFTHPDAGYPSDIRQCRQRKLEVGAVYEVTKVRRNVLTASVELRSFRDIHFNVVHFENA